MEARGGEKVPPGLDAAAGLCPGTSGAQALQERATALHSPRLAFGFSFFPPLFGFGRLR